MLGVARSTGEASTLILQCHVTPGMGQSFAKLLTGVVERALEDGRPVALLIP